MKLPSRRSETHRGGFTLAEVAVTLLIVAMGLLLVMEGLNRSKSMAAQASYRRAAVELALLSIGRIEGGELWEELDGLPSTLSGSYAEDGYEDFYWEIAIGDEELPEYEQDGESPYFDNFAHRRYVETEYGDDELNPDDAFPETGSTGGPYERVTIRVSFPKLTDQSNELVIERWIPLEQLYGRDESAPPLDDDSEAGA